MNQLREKAALIEGRTSTVQQMAMSQDLKYSLQCGWYKHSIAVAQPTYVLLDADTDNVCTTMCI